MTLNWIAFGQMGHWSEWYQEGVTKKEVLNKCKLQVHYYGNGYLRELQTGKEWEILPFMKSRLRLIPFYPKPLGF